MSLKTGGRIHNITEKMPRDFFFMCSQRMQIYIKHEATHDRDSHIPVGYDTIRYDTRCYFNMRSKADMSQLNLPHGTNH